VFGQRWIASFDNISIYRWSFKINCGGSGVFVIGLASCFDKKSIQNAFYDKPYNYGFNIFNGRKVSYGEFNEYGDRSGTNDVVTMEVNFKEGTIIYFINGISQGTAFENIMRNITINYKMAITLQQPDDGCTLIQFEQF